MYELIILGLIPGTQIQINFNEWASVASLLGILGLMWRIHSSHIIRNTIITSFLAFEMRRKTHVIEAL